MNQYLNKSSVFSNMVFVTMMISITVLSCKSEAKPGREKETATADIPVHEIFELHKGRLSSSLQIPGELIPYQEVDLYAKENSFVKKLYVDIGSEVKAGQLLVTMEAPELNSQLAGAVSVIKSREAIYLASKANYDRLVETSKTPGTISPNDLEQAAARKNADFAQLQAAQAAEKQITETQNYLQIRAPFSGVIAARNVNPGAYVGPSGKGSEQPLFNLQEQKKLRLVISVPESHTSFLSAKNEVSFTVNAIPNQQFKARINRMAGAIDNRLRAQRIEMDVENKDRKLLPGMVAEVNLPLPSSDSTFIAPKSAVVNSTENVFVIRVRNNKAERVNVKTGREVNGMIEIFGELQPGDLILRSGNDEIRNGSSLEKTKTVSL